MNEHENPRVQPASSLAKGACSYWGWMLMTGILLIVLGTLALGPIVITTLSTVIFFGCLLLAAGIVQLVQAFYTHNWKEFFLALLMGVLSSTVGAIVIANPTVSIQPLTLILGIFFIAGGLFKIIVSLTANYQHWGWILVNGIVSLLLGGIIVYQWPASSLWVIGTLLAIDLIVSGWSYIILALSLRTHYCTTDKN